MFWVWISCITEQTPDRYYGRSTWQVSDYMDSVWCSCLPLEQVRRAEKPHVANMCQQCQNTPLDRNHTLVFIYINIYIYSLLSDTFQNLFPYYLFGMTLKDGTIHHDLAARVQETLHEPYQCYSLLTSFILQHHWIGVQYRVITLSADHRRPIDPQGALPNQLALYTASFYTIGLWPTRSASKSHTQHLNVMVIFL